METNAGDRDSAGDLIKWNRFRNHLIGGKKIIIHAKVEEARSPLQLYLLLEYSTQEE